MFAIAGALPAMYNRRWGCKHNGAVSRPALTGINLLLEVRKIRLLRKPLQSRSNSGTVRRVIDERRAVETGLKALGRLRKLGGLQDVFGRAPAKKR